MFKHGDSKTDYNLWKKMTYGTSAYVGEGVISFDLYCGNPAWESWIEKAVRPNIEFQLRTQLPDAHCGYSNRRTWMRNVIENAGESL